MDIFREVQPKCSECGAPLRKEVSLGPSPTGSYGSTGTIESDMVEPLPTGSHASTYECAAQGFRIYCPNPNCNGVDRFISFDDLRAGRGAV